MAPPTPYPLGARTTLRQLELAPHQLLAQLREREPVSWVPALEGWLVTRYDLALTVMREAERFTVDDPRFSTARVVGASMLSLDGAQHTHHRAPFLAPFRAAAVNERFASTVCSETERLIDSFASRGRAELRREFAGPLAASVVAGALGLDGAEVSSMLGWYDAIVGAVTEVTAGGPVPDAAVEAFSELRARLEAVISAGAASLLGAAAARENSLSIEQIVSNAAVLLFGGIETTEGMIANAVLALLEHPDQLALVLERPELLDGALEESLRLEPAAAVIDRYAVGDVEVGGAHVRGGELVRVSISAANRDPAVFADPDRFDVTRPDARRHLAFAQGPHVCVGVHLARLEARAALAALLARLPGLRLDAERPAAVMGLVFRKPARVDVVWDRHPTSGVGVQVR